jgi:hypothetical protein
MYDEEELTPSYCPLCRKEFYPTPSWVYKIRRRFYCSYHCYRKATGAMEKKYKYKAVEQYTLDNVYIRTFRTASQAAEYIGSSVNGLADACRKKEKFKGYLWRYKEDAVPEV